MILPRASPAGEAPARSSVPAMFASAGAKAVLEHIRPGADIILPLANGEPCTLLDAIEANVDDLKGVKVHQMHALHDRPVPPRRVREPAASRLVLPLPCDTAAVPDGHGGSGAQQLQ